MSKIEKQKVSKIEIDEKTNEPSIVEVEVEYKETDKKKNVSPDEKKKDSIGKQIVMNNVLGFDNEELDDPIDKRRKTFKKICTILFITFVVGVLLYTILDDFVFSTSRADFLTLGQFLETLKSNWIYLPLALVAFVSTLFFKGVKIASMCKSTTGKFHFKVSFATAIVGQFYNLATPLAVGGQPFEIYHLSKHGIKGGKAASIPIATYVINQLAFIIVAALALISYKKDLLNLPHIDYLPDTIFVLAIIGLALTLVIPSLVVIFAIMPRLCSKLVYFVFWIGKKLNIVKNPKVMLYKTLRSVLINAKTLKSFFKKPLLFLRNLIYSCGEHLALCSIAYFVLRFFGFNWEAKNVMEWLQVMQICIIITSAVSFVPTPGNSGAFDLSFYAIFSQELAKGLAVPAMMVWRFISFYLFLIVGISFVRISKKKDKKIALLNDIKQ